MRGRMMAAAALAAVAATPLLAQSPLIAQRITAYRELGSAFKNVNDELRSSTPAKVVLQLSAREILAVSRNQYGWFPAGSGPTSGAKTKAKGEIWSQPAQFKAAQDAFAREAAAFAKLSGGSDVAALRAQAKKLGATCAACHRSFRTEP